MKNGRRIEIGHRFMAADLRLAPAITAGAWEIVQVFEATDGLLHARLANTVDRSLIKTVAQAALLDRNLFRRAD